MQDNEELKHYGVLGMKWGVHRATRLLSSSKSSGDKEGASKALSNLEKHRGKITKKLNKLENNSEKLEKKRYKMATKGDVKAAKYEQKAAKLTVKSLKTRSAEKAFKLDRKAKILTMKAAKLKANSTNIKAKIEKNERLKKVYGDHLSSVNKTLMSNGRKFVA